MYSMYSMAFGEFTANEVLFQDMQFDKLMNVLGTTLNPIFITKLWF